MMIVSGQRLVVLALTVLAIHPTVPASAFTHPPSLIRAVRPRHICRRPTSPITPVLSSRTIATLPPISISPITSTTTNLPSFFGLGPGELVIVAIAGLVLVGPSKLAEFSKEAGSVAGKAASGMGDEWSDLKAIPEEFQKGVTEGEIEARSRKAKGMEEVEPVVEEQGGK